MSNTAIIRKLDGTHQQLRVRRDEKESTQMAHVIPIGQGIRMGDDTRATPIQAMALELAWEYTLENIRLELR